MGYNFDTSKLNIKYTAKDNSFKLSFADNAKYETILDSCTIQYSAGQNIVNNDMEIGDFNFEAKIDNPCPIEGCATEQDKTKMRNEVSKVQGFVYSSLMHYPSVKRTIVNEQEDLPNIIKYHNDNNEVLRNYDDRREESEIKILVMHYTVSDAPRSFNTLTTPRGVSSHYTVDKNGEVMQLVPESKSAWHGGLGYWKGINSINQNSIGIEIVNSGINTTTNECEPYSDAQIKAVEVLSLDILERNKGILPEYVIGHSDLAPSRKIDPGHCFPWHDLAKKGIGKFPEVKLPEVNEVIFTKGSKGPEITRWKDNIAKVGYKVTPDDNFGEPEEQISQAFHMHYLAKYPVTEWDTHGETMLVALVGEESYLTNGA
ncbi:N-acetylmuramoyl-L-alanine amidase AmiD precursor [Rickettsiales bacterium Ac37b]|nr:N-acetylmuramoyl-L-alanine amidase AmiD precursor [Rickettsiales bacterium Ac37b]